MMNVLIETIYDTVQGEGYWSGMPCSLVRTWGCPVGCWFCDTGYAKGTPPPENKVAMSIDDITPARNHVILTGGEPMAQKVTPSLVQALIDRGHRVQVETSGVKWAEVPSDTWLTFSPKAHLGAKCADEFWSRADEGKIVLTNHSDSEYYAEQLHRYDGRLYFQPEYGNMKESTELCIEACLTFGGQVSMQTHKLMGLP